MKTTKHTEKQIIAVLREGEASVNVAGLFKAYADETDLVCGPYLDNTEICLFTVV